MFAPSLNVDLEKLAQAEDADAAKKAEKKPARVAERKGAAKGRPATKSS